jgi:hypothetical protein
MFWPRRILPWLVLIAGLVRAPSTACAGPIFNVRDFGAAGLKADDARPAIQKAIDACAATRDGTILLPPGEYTSGTLRLRSHIRIEIAEGATLFASTDPAAFTFETVSVQAALFFGDQIENVTIEGKGTIHGQAAYDWREDDFERTFSHKESMMKLGKPLWRTFPKGFPQRTLFPRLAWIGRSKDIRFNGLKWIHSPSWAINLYACERVTFDGLYVHSSLKEGVWADGIDLDGCKDITIANCRIETGDDCVVFISSNVWGPILPCENITVSNCVLSSASAGVKFSEGNWNGIRNVRVTDSVLTNVNRGFVFSTTQGGDISNVVLSNLTIHCNRFDWFWAGDGQPFHFRITRLSEFTKEAPKPDERPPGTIRNVTIRNVVAHGKGTSRIHGHAENWIDGLALENLKLTLSTDPAAHFDYADHALDLRRARNVTIRGLELNWGAPSFPAWQSALFAEDIENLALDQFAGAGYSRSNSPALVLQNVQRAVVTRAQAREGTSVFLKASGPRTSRIQILDGDFSQAKTAFLFDTNVVTGEIQLKDNVMPQGSRPVTAPR